MLSAKHTISTKTCGGIFWIPSFVFEWWLKIFNYNAIVLAWMKNRESDLNFLKMIRDYEMDTEQIRGIILEFGRQLKNYNIPIDSLILFGSYAKGNFHQDSDLDIAVISPDFGKNRLLERIQLMNISAKIDSRIEPHPISLKDWQEGWKEIVCEIHKTGIPMTVNL